MYNIQIAFSIKRGAKCTSFLFFHNFSCLESRYFFLHHSGKGRRSVWSHEHFRIVTHIPNLHISSSISIYEVLLSVLWGVIKCQSWPIQLQTKQTQLTVVWCAVICITQCVCFALFCNYLFCDIYDLLCILNMRQHWLKKEIEKHTQKLVIRLIVLLYSSAHSQYKL